MIGLLLGVSASLACDALASLPEQVQVAWVSPVRRTARAKSGIYVVKASELRTMVSARGRDATRVLQGLGLAGKSGRVRTRYKVVVFDVRADQLCRPVEGAEGTMEAGLARCPSEWQGRPTGVKSAAWPGCGYLLGTDSGQRTLDVYAISWEQASTQGFCVLPFERFLEEG